MTLHVSLSKDGESRLIEEAVTAGKDVSSLVTELLKDRVAESELERPSRLTADEWAAELDAWAASHRTLDSIADDSRESIYTGRSEAIRREFRDA